MSSIPQVSSVATSIIGRIGPRGVESRGTSAVAPSVSSLADQVEISASAIDAARLANEAQSQTSTLEQARQARINAVRQQIQNGTYDLESKSTVVADRLARALRSI